ncbi:hypothetical protein C4K88_16485 [Arthrobacter pityocampae]|uniref:TIR domain-containing protein n=1 Tax=Arthrobacter pityocampae TaxID=547334 RepID=A0A2S5IU31_9MICC|nr:toll/interleukin-1 receptor domain-containing protein [Arthrobacter pityocampae]PPB48046.1 hypothetical protein C4K88_16485 [Arthrobacter pityocampae]
MAIDYEKLRLLRAVSEQMTSMSLADLNMVLYEAGIAELPDHWEGDDNYGPTDDDTKKRIASTTLRDLTRAQLREISTALQQVFDAPEIGVFVEDESPLQLFASHLTTQQSFVKKVADALKTYGVTLFVAHEDVAVDDEWHTAIETSLQSVHGGVVFLLPRIIESAWCDQEVGWLLGRGVPVLGLKFSGQDPYGPFGKKQAQPVPSAATAEVVAASIMEWASKKPQLRQVLNTSLSFALQKSWRYDMSNAIWEHLSESDNLDSNQVAAITIALRDNDQVYGAECRVGPQTGKRLVIVIFDHLRKQPGYADNEELIAEAATLRRVPGFTQSDTLADTKPAVTPRGVSSSWTNYSEPPF